MYLCRQSTDLRRTSRCSKPYVFGGPDGSVLGENDFDSHDTTFGDAGDYASSGAPRASCWPNRLSGQAFCGESDRKVGVTQRAARRVKTVRRGQGERKVDSGQAKSVCRAVSEPVALLA